jgi:protein-serine/threonine kinase
LITSADRRLSVEQIKKHEFFYGVNWETIRRIGAPFVPHLRSITDTSYFPTDEIDQADEEKPADTAAVNKDLAFLGSVDLSGMAIDSLSYLSRYTFKRFSVS